MAFGPTIDSITFEPCDALDFLGYRGSSPEPSYSSTDSSYDSISSTKSESPATRRKGVTNAHLGHCMETSAPCRSEELPTDNEIKESSRDSATGLLVNESDRIQSEQIHQSHTQVRQPEKALPNVHILVPALSAAPSISSWNSNFLLANEYGKGVC